MLDIRDLSVTYGGNTPKLAVRDVSLHMKQGEIVSIVGESGSGKSTLIRAVIGCIPTGGYVSKGDIRFLGKSLIGCSGKEWQQMRGKEISMIFQDSKAMLNPIRRIGTQYVEYIREHEVRSKKDAWEKGVCLLQQMHLMDADNIMQSYPFQLSRGMCQRVSIAMAMTFQPKLLLADEPTSALDVINQAQIIRQMTALRERNQTSLLLVTHHLGMAAYISDRILVMKEGRIVEEGSRRQILYAPQTEYTKSLLSSVPTMGGDYFGEST